MRGARELARGDEERLSHGAQDPLEVRPKVALREIRRLSALADELYAASESPYEPPDGLFKALASQAVANAYDNGPGEALTGPVVRGDVDVLAVHLSEIEKRAPHLIPAYAAMAAETVRLALRSDRLDEDSATAMLVLISGFMRGHGGTSGET